MAQASDLFLQSGTADEVVAAVGEDILRPKSAPPQVAAAGSSLFSFGSGFTALFGDIRLSENYELFAQTTRDPRLPAPLQYSLYRDLSMQRETASASAASISPLASHRSHEEVPAADVLQRIWGSGPSASTAEVPSMAAATPSDAPFDPSWRASASTVEGLEAQLAGLQVGPAKSPPRIPSPQKPPSPGPVGQTSPRYGASGGAPGGPASSPGPGPYVAGVPSLGSAPPAAVPPARPPCHFYAAGRCTRGASCPFSHSMEPAPAPAGAAPWSPQARGGSPRYYGPAAPSPAAPYAPPHHSPYASPALPAGGGGDALSYGMAPPMGMAPASPYGAGVASPPMGGPMGSPHGRGRKDPRYHGPRFNMDSKIVSFEQAVGRMLQLSRDQWGCRFLQAKLDENPAHVTAVLAELLEPFAELMIDPFGNYLCQKVLEKASPQQRCAIIQRVMPSLVSISLNMHGTRAVQKLIECVSSPEEGELIRNAFGGAVVPLILDLNGNHVIQRCLHHLGPQYNQFIYNAVAADLVTVATHRHGCCVLQRCIDFASLPQKMQLLGVVAAHARALVCDAYGNYVVQYALDQHVPSALEQITLQLLGSVAELSMHMFSSHVVEKCIRLAPAELRTRLCQELVQPDTLPLLLRDAFGNYVVQTALGAAEADPALFAFMAEAIRPHLAEIRHTPQGKRIATRLEAAAA